MENMKIKKNVTNGIGKGVWSYDYKHDILLLKRKDLLYEMSMDIAEYSVHFDPSGMVMGIEIEDASKVLGHPKSVLRQICYFRYDVQIEEKKILLRIILLAKLRNREFQWEKDIERSLQEQHDSVEVSCSTK